jgi:hypothetical protein
MRPARGGCNCASSARAKSQGCQSAAFSNPDAIAGVALHALALDDEGDAVLLAGGAGQWLSLSMPARAGAAARRHDLSIPAEAVDPRLMHGARAPQ